MIKNNDIFRKNIWKERHIYVMRCSECKRGSRGLGACHRQAKIVSRALDTLLAKTKYTFLNKGMFMRRVLK